MESYTSFAEVYDTFMDNVPYAEWAKFYQELIARYGITKPTETIAVEDVLHADEAATDPTTETKSNPTTDPATASNPIEEYLSTERNLIVDLGCGTGRMTEIFKTAGYDIMGVDNSEEMLNLALTRRDQAGHDTMYIEQDMRELELYGTAGTFISVCDCVNYLVTDEDMIAMFRGVNTYLYAGGVFIFDFNTLHKYRDVIGDTTIAENREDCAFIWDNWFHETDHINEYNLHLFLLRPTEDADTFTRVTETHYQKGYTFEEMKELANKGGLRFVAAFDADTQGEVLEDSERIVMVLREHGKEI